MVRWTFYYVIISLYCVIISQLKITEVAKQDYHFLTQGIGSISLEKNGIPDRFRYSLIQYYSFQLHYLHYKFRSDQDMDCQCSTGWLTGS